MIKLSWVEDHASAFVGGDVTGPVDGLYYHSYVCMIMFSI